MCPEGHSSPSWHIHCRGSQLNQKPIHKEDPGWQGDHPDNDDEEEGDDEEEAIKAIVDYFASIDE